MWNSASITTTAVYQGLFSLSIHFSLFYGFYFWVLGIYGTSTEERKPLFLHELSAWPPLMGNLWIFVGDFKIIRWPHENSNGCPTNRYMSDSNDFIDQHSLIDLPLINGRFTWADYRTPPTNSLIDRFLCTNGILDKLGDGTIKRLARPVSDHYPLQLTLDNQTWGPLPFKFENMWLNHKEFIPFLKDWWSSNPLMGRTAYGFIKK